MASVTGAGNFANASAVPVALMPSPPTIMAMRGAAVLSAGSLRGCAKTTNGRPPSAEIFGMAP